MNLDFRSIVAPTDVSTSKRKVSMNEIPPEPNPLLFWETVNAYQRTAALRAGVELKLFSAIARGASTPQALAERCGASERGIRILCDYLTIIGFLVKSDQGYTLTPDSAAFLDEQSPAYLGGMLPFLNTKRSAKGFSLLTDAVRRGGTALDQEGYMSPDDPVWIEFAKSMPPIVIAAANFIAEAVSEWPGIHRVLDLAAGHGLFGIKIAEKNTTTEIIAQDWNNVLAVARDNARKAGIKEQRYHLLPGNAFELTFPRPCDLVLITNFLHHFDLPTCGKLLRKVHDCLGPTGRVVTLEFIPNPDRTSPPIPAAFSMMMLGLTPRGDAYTFAELDELFRQNGFSRNELVPVPHSSQHLVISYKG
jgi:SAM-dependent methyltransferase